MTICPLCQAPTEVVATYDGAHIITTTERHRGHIVGVCDSIRSALNVGTMLRAADGIGLDHVYLCGLTAGVDNPKVIKTALGAQKTVATTSYPDITMCIADLVEDGYEVWAVESTPTSELLTDRRRRPAKLAFVVGNETAGVDPDVLRAARRHVHLPMQGHKASLNVGVAFGIVAYGLAAVGVDDHEAPGPQNAARSRPRS